MSPTLGGNGSLNVSLGAQDRRLASSGSALTESTSPQQQFRTNSGKLSPTDSGRNSAATSMFQLKVNETLTGFGGSVNVIAEQMIGSPTRKVSASIDALN